MQVPPPRAIVVCGVEDSPQAPAVAHAAADLAARLGRPLLLVHVAPPPVVLDRPAASHGERLSEAEAFEQAGYMRTVFEQIDVTDRPGVVRAVEFGDPATTLAELANSHEASLIVVGSGGHGMLGSIFTGSTAAALTRDAPCPVLVVPPGAARSAGETVVCGVDGSEASVAVASVARLMADRLDLAVVLAHVGEAGAADELRELAEPPAEFVHLDGSPSEALMELARDRRAELLVVGTRGRGPATAAVLGSVSADLVRHSDRPVVVLPPAAKAWRASGPAEIA
jgi:nucleotide-binding universal stress UspA family protein